MAERLDRDRIADVANALDAALEVRDARIGWAGAYDHGTPPSTLEVASGIVPRLRQLGWALVRIAPADDDAQVPA